MTKPTEWCVLRGEWPTHAEQREQAYKLLQQLVGFFCTIGHDDAGAPCIEGRPDLHVSISHCRAAVAAAVSSEGAIGIDVESRRRIGDGLMERVCTPDEIYTIHNASDPTMQFLRFWTRKEAVLKMRRTGIKGFSSMLAASAATDCVVEEIDCGDAEIVASVAILKA